MNNLGMAYNGMGRHTEALDVLRRLLEIDPDHIEAKANLGLALKGLGRLDQAEGALRQALDACGGSRKMRAVAHQRLGDVYLQRGRLSEALTAFRASLSEDSTYAAAHFGLGEVHFQQADTARALASFKAFLDRWRGGGGPGQMAKQRIQTLEGR